MCIGNTHIAHCTLEVDPLLLHSVLYRAKYKCLYTVLVLINWLYKQNKVVYSNFVTLIAIYNIYFTPGGHLPVTRIEEAFIGAAPAVLNAAVNAVELSRKIGLDMISGKALIEANELNVIHLRNFGVELILIKIEGICGRCSNIQNQKEREEKEKELKKLKDVLEACKATLNELSGPQKGLSMPKFMKSSSNDNIISRIRDILDDIEDKVELYRKEIESIIQNQRCKSIASSCSEIDFPTPDAMQNFEVYAKGECIMVKWTDNPENRNVGRYEILVRGDEIGEMSIPCETKCRTNYLEAISTNNFPIEGWCTYYVKVRAISQGGTPGKWTDLRGVFMNQHPPNEKPRGLKALCGHLPNSIKIRVHRPERFDDFDINMCHLSGTQRALRSDKGATSIFERVLACKFTREKEKEEIIVLDIVPDTEYKIKICFRNKWGMDPKFESDELPPFMINARPSAPVISYTRSTSDHETVTVKLNFKTDVNAGSVSNYRLRMKTKECGDWTTSSVEEDCIELKLKRKTIHYFYAVSQSLGGVISGKSRIEEIKT